MRTSNKILLTVFVAILLTLTSIYGAIYVKYTNKSFITSARLHEERYDIYPLTAVQSVSLAGLDRVTIIPSDTARLEVEKENGSKTIHAFSNGVLTMKGDTTIIRQDGTSDKERNYRDVLIYLPFTQTIKANNCNLTIKGAAESGKNLTVQIELAGSDLQLGFFDRPDIISPGYFNAVHINSTNGGSVNVAGNIAIKNIEVNLQAARFEDGGAALDSLVLSADATSKISVTGKNIPNTSFKTKP